MRWWKRPQQKKVAVQQEDILVDIHTRQCAITLLLAKADIQNTVHIQGLIQDAKEVAALWQKQQH